MNRDDVTWQGYWPACPTPFHEDGSYDADCGMLVPSGKVVATAALGLYALGSYGPALGKLAAGCAAAAAEAVAALDGKARLFVPAGTGGVVGAGTSLSASELPVG